MTRRRDLERHRDSLGEIGEILSSMKTLAYMETRKLSRFLDAQGQIVAAIEEAAADFLSFEPGILPDPRHRASVLILIGSERGFCGDFNQAIVDRLATLRADGKDAGPRLIAVGRKLQGLLENDPDVAARVEGASVAEDVGGVLQRIVDELNAFKTRMTDLELLAVHHTSDQVHVESLLPPFEQQRLAAQAYSHPPLLNVAPAEFVLDLTEHYLLAALNHMLYTSLMVENNRRVLHLEHAVGHIEDESLELTRKCRALRQEEIVEEIEVILLSTASLGDNEAQQSSQ